VKASTIEEALRAITNGPAPTGILAGGTDLLLQQQHGKKQACKSLVDITDVRELTQITKESDGLRIGAAVKLADIEQSELVKNFSPVLVEGAGEVGSLQIRNLATIGGNICNASPSADTIPPLLALDAQLSIVSSRGEREISLDKFFKGPGVTVLKEDELLASIFIPAPEQPAKGTYIKLKAREALDLAFVGVAVLVTGSQVRIALGAVAPTPLRAIKAEKLLMDSAVKDIAAVRKAAEAAAEEISPISDVRASAEYRREMTRTLTERALARVLGLLDN